jgi:uncharacterized membrane protein
LHRWIAAFGLAAVLGLGGCQQKADAQKALQDKAAAPSPGAAQELPPVPAAFRGDFDAVGTEPFWAARIRADGITIMQPDAQPVIAPNQAPRMAGPQAVWASMAGDEPVLVAMVEQDCSDGMSDRVYPYAVELQLGDQTFIGCADRPGE